MLRKFSASGFAFAMIALIALRFPALGFCLCQHDVVLDPASCCMHPAAQQAQQAVGDSCPAEPAPYDDCVVILSLDPGDFTWSADRFSPAPQAAVPMALPAGLQDELPAPAAPRNTSGSIRGSPPRSEPAACLRSQVLRL